MSKFTDSGLYYNEMMMGFEDILRQYQTYHKQGTTISNFVQRLRKNYSYNGHHQYFRKQSATSEQIDCFQAFILLVDHLALVDRSGIVIRDLLKSIKGRGFSLVDMDNFSDDVYDIFTRIQKNHFYNLQKRDEKALAVLSKYYKTDSSGLKAYYNYMVYNKEFASIPVVSKKLEYDISQMARENKEEADNFKAQLKEIKKKMNRFSQSMGLPSRIKKMTSENSNNDNDNDNNKSNSDSELIIHATPSPTATSDDSIEEGDNSIDNSNNNINSKKEDAKKETEKREDYEKFYYLERDRENYIYSINAEKQEKRRLQQRNKKIAHKAAFLTSIGEGIVGANAIILLNLFFPPVAVFLVAWFIGWFINNLLYRNDNKDVLDAFTLKKKVKNETGEIVSKRLIFIDENGKPLSLNKRIGLSSVFGLTLCTGVVYGVLSFMSSKAVFTNLFISASNLLTGFFTSHLPIALTIFGCVGAACPAIAMFIGMTCIFFKVIADFVRKNRYQKICDYVYENFKAPWHAMGAWQYDWKERMLHLGKCAGRVLLLGVTIAATMVFTVASMGIFYQQTLSFLSVVSRPTQIISIITTFVNAIISLAFQIDGANKVLQPVCRRHTFSGLMNKEIELAPLSPVQKEASRIRTLGCMAVALTAAGNGVCMGDLNQITDPSSLQPLKMGFLAKQVNPSLLKYGTIASSSFCSGLPNGNVGLSVFKRKEPRMDIKSDQQAAEKARLRSYRHH